MISRWKTLEVFRDTQCGAINSLLRRDGVCSTRAVGAAVEQSLQVDSRIHQQGHESAAAGAAAWLIYANPFGKHRE
jgi:hypothetical protein